MNPFNFFTTFAKTETQSVRAFTLVETLVSTFIISVVILGPLTVAINASTYSRQTKDIMVATYLAQEAVELLHHQQDSLYLKCAGDTSVNVVCPPITISTGDYEVPKESAWRLFKNYLTSGVSCFAVAGCSYDFIDMTSNEDAAPTKYLPSNASCSTLFITASYLYVCSGAHGSGGTATSFARTVFVESISTFDSSDLYDIAYNDDLRVTVSVSFRRQNGYTRTVKLVDFLHARP